MRSFSLLLKQALGAFALLSLVSTARAAELSVPTQYATIQAAITAAAPGDTVLLDDGTYTGAGNKDLDFHGKAITVRSASGDPTRCIIDCERNGRGFLFQSGESAASTLADLTIQNGASFVGTGVFISGSSPTISHCTFTGNQAENGGSGMAIENGSNPAIINCTFTGNSAYNGGGGMLCDGSNPTVINCTFTANTADRFGGGMANSGSNPTVINCTFTANTADRFGGGMANSGSNPTVINCTFTANTTDRFGGGMYNFSRSNPAVTNCTFIGNQNNGMTNSNISSPTVTNCTFTANQNNGMTNSNISSPTVTNCTFTANQNNGMNNNGSSSPTVTNCTFTANQNSGMTNSNNSSPTVTNCTFTANQNSGMFNFNNSPTVTNCTFTANQNSGMTNFDSSPTVTNCVLWGDTGGEVASNSSSSPVITYCDIQGGYAGTGNLNADPHFVRNPSPGPDGQWGTPDDDYGDLHLQTGSPALDAGNTAALPADTADLNNNGDTAEPLPLDLDGNARVSRASVDQGAYEYQNQAPTATSQNLSLDQDTNLAITLTGSDPENDALTFAVATDPTHGTLSGSGANLTYTPNPGYVGSDSFTFTVADPFGAGSDVATIRLTVKDKTAPVITLNGSDPMTVTQGSAFTDPGATALDNVDGSVPVGVSGSVNTALPGSYLLTYTATDQAGNSASKTRTVTVIAPAVRLTITVQAIARVGNVVVVLVKVTNPGATRATNVKLTSANLIGVNAFLILPCDSVSLNPGQSQEALLSFYPLRKGQRGTLSIQGTSSLGAFSLSQNVTIP